MLSLATVLMSVLGSLIGGVVVAYVNNRFQRDREELKVLREKGEVIVSGLKTLSELYIEKYNVARVCRTSGGKQKFNDKFGVHTELQQRLHALENTIYCYTVIYFPSCKPQLEKWQGKLGWCDRLVAHIASGEYSKQYDDAIGSFVDKSHSHITELHTLSFDLSKAVASEIEVARSISPYAELKKAVRGRFDGTYRTLLAALSFSNRASRRAGLRASNGTSVERSGR